MRIYKLAAVSIALALLAAVFIVPDALAATVSPASDPSIILQFLADGGAAVAALRTQHQDLVSRAAAKIAEVKDGMAPEEVRRIEGEHADLVRQASEAQTRLAEAERQENKPPAPVVDLSAERARSAEIMTLAQRHAMPAEFAPKHIADGSTVDVVRGLILDDLAKRSGETRQTPHIRVTRDEGDTIRRAVESAIRLRANPGSIKPDSPEFEMARSWRGMSLIEMGRSYVEETMGVRLRGLNRREQATVLLGLELRAGMHSTSDFPNLLANVASKRLRDAYLAAPQNWKLISRQSNSPDFKTKSVVQLSNLPQFKQVRESEEFEYAGLSEGVESYALLTYGRIVAITRQALINDDLGAFDRIPTLLGRAAAEKEAAIVWSLLTTNSGLGQTMNDGFNLFDNTNHGNYTSSGTAISVASLDIGRQAMRTQTGLAEEDPDPLNLMPKFLIVSPARETVAQQFLATIIPALNSSVNPFANSLTQITEARLSGNGWYLVADPATIDTIEYAYLEGEEGLYTEQRIGFEVDGIEVKGRIDFAAHVIDWRGFYKNAGA